MPLYAYKCSKCEHTFDQYLSIAGRNAPCEAPCPECSTPGSISQLIGTPNIVSGVGEIVTKTPREFRDKLDAIKKNNRGSNIET